MTTKPAKPPVALLQLRLLDRDGAPMAIPEADLFWGPDVFQVKTNDKGVVIPFDADPSANPPTPVVVPRAPGKGELYLKIGFKPGELVRSPFMVLSVFLDDFGAADTPRGAAARLCNLGYLPLAGPPATALPASMSAAAVDGLRRFRQANGLVTPGGAAGTIEAAARDRLADAHDNPAGTLLKAP